MRSAEHQIRREMAVQRSAAVSILHIATRDITDAVFKMYVGNSCTPPRWVNPKGS